jgi:hypothetical protein
MVVFGMVVHAEHSERLPLTYCRRAFGTHASGLFLPLASPEAPASPKITEDTASPEHPGSRNH